MKVLKNQRGSTSVLVIILMVVLIVFGLAIFTTSLSSVRLANKKTQWTQSYYALEKESAHALASIDQLTKDIYQSIEDKALLVSSIESLLSINTGELVITNQYTDKYDFEVNFNIDSIDNLKSKHIEVVLGIISPEKRTSTQFDLLVYEQWQDDFEFYNLPGFEDPLTTPVEFNLEDAKEE
jgi:hypothetical protein